MRAVRRVCVLCCCGARCCSCERVPCRPRQLWWCTPRFRECSGRCPPSSASTRARLYSVRCRWCWGWPRGFDCALAAVIVVVGWIGCSLLLSLLRHRCQEAAVATIAALKQFEFSQARAPDNGHRLFLPLHLGPHALLQQVATASGGACVVASACECVCVCL